jgi:hypothetical protein
LRGLPSARGASKLIAPVGGRHHAGDSGNRDVLAGADIDQLVAGIGQMHAGVGGIVDIEEFAPPRAGASDDHDVISAGTLSFVEATDQGGGDVAIFGPAVLASP